MQNIDLICVGKLNAKYFAEGVAEYQKRLAAFAAFRIIELPEEKIVYDMEYIEHRSVWMDLLCILKTIRVVFCGDGAR